MSIELQEARKKLDILEKIANNPELIMTDVFSEDTESINFLYQVKINEKHILEYFTDYLGTLHIFNNTLLKFRDNTLNIYVPELNYKCEQFKSEDKIIKVNLGKKVYKVCCNDIQKYSDVMATVYELETCELSDFWKKYENFTFRNRVKNAFKTLITDKKLHIRLWDFVFTLIVSKKKVNAAVEREREKVNNNNKNNQKLYNKQIELQNYYIKNAPNHIDSIHSKQNDIAKYLISLGYQEDKEMSEH